MAQDDSQFQVGDTFSIATWGRLAERDIAQRGIDVLIGMVRAHHVNCTAPNHFWCAPSQMRVFVMADLYQADGTQGEHYIGRYLRGADFNSDGVPTIHETPSLKAIMQLMDDGRVFVHFGRLVDQGNGRSAGDFGLLGQQTGERLVVTPRPVPNVPQEPGRHITFVLQRFNDAWNIAHFPHDDELPGNAQVRVIATLPVSPNPSPQSQIEINDFPPE